MAEQERKQHQRQARRQRGDERNRSIIRVAVIGLSRASGLIGFTLCMGFKPHGIEYANAPAKPTPRSR